jgi:alpha,alpha-trehalose phosphorylase
MYPSVLDAALRFDGGWTLVEDLLRTAGGPAPTGALFTTSNGYVGLRGRAREPFGGDGLVLLSGCYETRPYAHPEQAHGAPEHYQTIVAVTDPDEVAITVDGEGMDPTTGTWLEHERRLDLRTGCITTVGRWRSPAGRDVALRTRRFTSITEVGVTWLEVEVEPLDRAAQVAIELTMRASTGDRTFPDEPEALSRAWGRVFHPLGTLDGAVGGLVHATALSRIAVACASSLAGVEGPATEAVDDDCVSRTVSGSAGPGEPLRARQRAAFADGPADGAAALLARAAANAGDRSISFGEALAAQRARLDDLWTVARVDLDGAPDIEAAVRFCTFQVLQGSTCRGERASPAKGLTGQGYEGHHLWDQEVYAGPVLTALLPDAARAAHMFRCRTIEQARDRASQLSQHGAQFPWRTIDGTEASAFFPAGAAQHHVNADIAWAIEHYLACTGDDSCLEDGAREVLVETARTWMSIGRFDRHGSFHIEGVTGPDEYTALVDDNLYTNAMAAWNLRCAADRVEQLAADDSDAHRALVDGLEIGPDEPTGWRRAALAMARPYDDELQVHGQDAHFLERGRWDLAATPPDRFPLQDHHHLLHLYRHEVLKQADVVLAQVLLPDDFSLEQRRRDFAYYEPLTSHDSSLSAPVHAVAAAAIGRSDLAWEYTRQTAFTDLDGGNGALGDGLHLAACAGAWLAVVAGFGGYSTHHGELHLDPRRPPGVDRLRFAVRHRGSMLEVTVDEEGTTYRVLEGGALTVHHGEGSIEVPADGTIGP